MAGGREIFKLFGSVMVDTDKAEKSLHQTEKKAGSLAQSLGKGIKSVAKMGVAVGAGATAAVGAVASLAGKAAEAADTVDKASQRMNVSAETFIL